MCRAAGACQEADLIAAEIVFADAGIIRGRARRRLVARAGQRGAPRLAKRLAALETMLGVRGDVDRGAVAAAATIEPRLLELPLASICAALVNLRQALPRDTDAGAAALANPTLLLSMLAA